MEYKEKLRSILRLKNYPTKYNTKITTSKTKPKSIKSGPIKAKRKVTMTQVGNKKLNKDIDDECVMELAKCDCQRPTNPNDPLTSEIFLKRKSLNDDRQELLRQQRQQQPQSIPPTKNSIIWQLKDEVPVVFTGSRPNEQTNKNYLEITDARLQQQQPQFTQQQVQFPQQQLQFQQPQDPRFVYPPIIQTPNSQASCKRPSAEGKDIFDDEDRVFALMLIPFMRKFSDAQKDYAKIEILQIIQKTHNMPIEDLQKSKANKAMSNASSTDVSKKGKDKHKKKSKHPGKGASDGKLDKKEKSTTKKKSTK